MSNNVGINNGININVGGVDQVQQQSPACQRASQEMNIFDPLSVLSKVAEVLKGVMGSCSGG
jgi:hypothetical protein